MMLDLRSDVEKRNFCNTFRKPDDENDNDHANFSARRKLLTQMIFKDFVQHKQDLLETDYLVGDHTTIDQYFNTIKEEYNSKSKQTVTSVLYG